MFITAPASIANPNRHRYPTSRRHSTQMTATCISPKNTRNEWYSGIWIKRNTLNSTAKLKHANF